MVKDETTTSFNRAALDFAVLRALLVCFLVIAGALTSCSFDEDNDGLDSESGMSNLDEFWDSDLAAGAQTILDVEIDNVKIRTSIRPDGQLSFDYSNPSDGYGVYQEPAADGRWNSFRVPPADLVVRVLNTPASFDFDSADIVGVQAEELERRVSPGSVAWILDGGIDEDVVISQGDASNLSFSKPFVMADDQPPGRTIVVVAELEKD